MPGTTYSVSQVIDKTLIALVDTPVYKLPLDSQQPFATVKAGQPVGVVFSWLDPSAERSVLYWMFYTSDGKAYYAKNLPGQYDVNSLRQQGVLTTQEVIAAEQAKNNTWYENIISKYGGYVLGTIVLVALGSAAIKGYLSKPKN